MKKICPKCRKEKSITDFHKNGEHQRYSVCKECKNGSKRNFRSDKNYQTGYARANLIFTLRKVVVCKKETLELPRNSFVDLDWLLKTKRLKRLSYHDGDFTLIAKDL